MTNRLLPLFGMAFVAAAANAQWVAPVEPEAPATPAKPALADVDTSIKDVVKSGHYYAIYNAETTTFMSNGVFSHTWATQGVANPNDFAVFLVEDVVTPGNLQMTGWVLRSQNYGASKNWMFTSGANEVHQDGANQVNAYYDIVKQENGTYRIHSVAANPTYGEAALADYANTWLGVPQSRDKKGDLELLDPAGTTATHYVDWSFIELEEYKALGEYGEIKALYDVKAQMFDLYSENLADELGADFEKYTATYENEEATLEELQEALAGMKEDLYQARLIKLTAGATEDEPADVTALITNPNIDGNANGWTNTFVGGTNATNVGYQGASYNNGDVTIQGFIEAWANSAFSTAITTRALGDGELSQTLKDMPAGKYVLGVDIIANNQDGKETTGVELFIKGGEIENAQSMATGNGKPEHFNVAFVSTGGDLYLGLRTKDATANWIAADNFTLKYYGEINENPYQVTLEGAIKDLEEKFSNSYAEADAQDAWAQAVEAAKTAVDTDDQDDDFYKEATAALQEAAKAYEASVAVYNKLIEAMQYADSRKLQADKYGMEELSDELSDLSKELNDAMIQGTYSAEECEAAIDLVKSTICDWVSENAKAGDNVTILLENPGFDKDFSGWTSKDNMRVDWGGMARENNGEGVYHVDPVTGEEVEGGLQLSDINSGCAEVYRQRFDISQTIKNMPAGLYELSCKAFERLDCGKQMGCLYAIINGEEQTQPFKILYNEGSEHPLYANATDTWDISVPDGPDGAYVPRGMCSANVYFANGYYKNKFTFFLNEAADITVGCRADGDDAWGDPADCNWILFDDFQIVYKGDGDAVWRVSVEDMFDELDANLSKAVDAEKCTSPLAEEINGVLDSAYTLLQNDETTADEFKAALQELKNAQAALDNCASLIGNYKTAKKNFDENATNYADYVGDADLKQKYEDMNSELQDNTVYLEKTVEELKAYIEDINTLVDDMKAVYDKVDAASNRINVEALDYFDFVLDGDLIAEYEDIQSQIDNEVFTTMSIDELDEFVAQVDKTVDAMKVWKETNEAMAAAATSVTAEATAALLDFVPETDTEIVERYNKLVEIVEAEEYTTYETLAEQQAFIDEVNAVVGKMTAYKLTAEVVLPEGYEAASDEEPVDFTSLIVNPKHDKIVEGWQIENRTVQNWARLANFNGVAGANAMEAWHPTAADLQFDVFQDIYGLPAGTYKLEALAAHSLNGQAPAEVDGVVNDGHIGIYALTGEVEQSDKVRVTEAGCDVADAALTYGVVFVISEEEAADVTCYTRIGVKTYGKQQARWFACDDWTLTYYGTESELNPGGSGVKVENVQGVVAEKMATAIYSIDGTRQSRLLKGVNIVKTTMSDGTIRIQKILVR